MKLDQRALERSFVEARDRLLAARNADGHWRGELSPSALSTATAVFALHVAGAVHENTSTKSSRNNLIRRGIEWLCRQVNEDGGWGDTVDSVSNLSTTCLAWAALEAITGGHGPHGVVVENARTWIENASGATGKAELADAVRAAYGVDRTFSVPILTMCALAGCLGDGREAWRLVPQLPFELAALRRSWFRRLGLQVVSYALPALIGIGIARHHHRPSRNPFLWTARGLSRRRTLRLLDTIQPSSGGFLEATPLTAFVVMSLASSGLSRHPVVDHGLDFLRQSVRPDGSWPIDTDLATWVTTLSINALAVGHDWQTVLDAAGRQRLRDWLLGQQYQGIHPYTDSRPGGWAWTDLPGGVPDVDDTAGALLALRNLDVLDEQDDERVRKAALAGIEWITSVQNRDGGMPTFCRGWGKLPFDRSGPDLTAHALRALVSWQALIPDGTRRVGDRCVFYLHDSQNEDGSWVPLWFGNQHVEGLENRTCGTARVLMALRGVDPAGKRMLNVLKNRGVEWLLAGQNADGGWGGAPGTPSSVEETALAVDALTDRPLVQNWPALRSSVERGAAHLVERIAAGDLDHPSPIGLYFARLWYSERLYPTIFSVAALARVRAALASGNC